MKKQFWNDRVMTPDWCARDMVEWFQPSGRILEPCCGDGAILKYLPGAEWCEIDRGRDFFFWRDAVDWIVSNPPYSQFRQWLRHSFVVADNIVYLVPARNLFSSWGAIAESYEFGGLQHMRFYGTGTTLGFPMGNAIAALYWRKSYRGPIGISFHGRKEWGGGVPNSVQQTLPGSADLDPNASHFG